MFKVLNKMKGHASSKCASNLGSNVLLGPVNWHFQRSQREGTTLSLSVGRLDAARVPSYRVVTPVDHAAAILGQTVEPLRCVTLPYWVKQWMLSPPCTKKCWHQNAATLRVLIRAWELQNSITMCCEASSCGMVFKGRMHRAAFFQTAVHRLYMSECSIYMRSRLRPAFISKMAVCTYWLCAWGLQTLITIFMPKSRD